SKQWMRLWWRWGRRNRVPFYHYSQNNSGGRFSVQEAEGITHHVIIEASDAAHANRRAESIGLYFDGCENDQDCSCCGDRWSRAYDPGDTVPLLYGSPPESHSPDMRFLDDDQPEWIIHYLD